MANESPTPPAYVAFGQGGSAFVGSEKWLNGEFVRSTVTWAYFENKAQGNVSIPTTQANGSYFAEFGVAPGASSGSDLYSRNLTAIGSKNNTFDVNVTFTPLFRRG